MSAQKQSISIPKILGSNKLSEVFGKINLSSDVKSLLTSLEAEISVRYNPDAEKPTVSVVSRAGKTVCSLEEFQALSGYRRFVNDAIKEVDRERSTVQKIERVGYYLRVLAARGTAVPARIVEQNYTKFNQLGTNLQVLAGHMEKVSECTENVWRTYMEDAIARVGRVLFEMQIRCMESTVLDREAIDLALLEVGVPRWLYVKLMDKSFTATIRDDAKSLMFPKGNYLKAIALSRYEIDNEGFMTKNRLILEKSGGMIHLARSDWGAILPNIPVELNDQVVAYLDKYQWVCTNPSSADEILTIRQSGKRPPVFKEALPPKNDGPKNRPESDVARICREASNKLGKIQAIWNDINNFVLNVSDPKAEFWDLFFGTDTWNIVPGNTLFDCIRGEAGCIATLDAMRAWTSRDNLDRVAAIVCNGTLIPSGSANSDVIRDIFRGILNRADFVERTAFADLVANYPIGDLSGMQTNPVTPNEITTARTFLGIRADHARARRATGAAAVRLHTEVINELIPIRDESYYNQVKEWLMTTFRAGSKRHELQKIAAERIVGEFIKRHGEMFVEEFNEEILDQVEEFYDTD